MNFIFYDVETTGLDLCFDQILQLGAIRTDEDLDPIEKFESRCRLLPYVIPSPGAVIATGISIAETRTCSLSHFEMMREVSGKFSDWSSGGAIFVGWNSMQFDELMLRQAYYQTLQPIYQTQRKGNGRADAMRITQSVASLDPGAMTWPRDSEERISFVLTNLALSNGIRVERAHEAMADAETTLKIARRVKKKCPDLWEEAISNAYRSNVLHIMQDEQLLRLVEMRDGSPSASVVTPISANSLNANEWGVFDLRFDPRLHISASDEELRNVIALSDTIRRVRINAQPSIFALEQMPSRIRGKHPPIRMLQERAGLVSSNQSFRSRISDLLAERYGKRDTPYVEQRIYSGFPSPSDQALLDRFQKSDWNRRADLIWAIEDERYRQLGQRLLAVERPDLLTTHQRTRYDSWLRDRLMTDGDVPWLTVPRAIQESKELRKAAPKSQLGSLDELDKLLLDLQNDPSPKH